MTPRIPKDIETIRAEMQRNRRFRHNQEPLLTLVRTMREEAPTQTAEPENWQAVLDSFLGSIKVLNSYHDDMELLFEVLDQQQVRAEAAERLLQVRLDELNARYDQLN